MSLALGRRLKVRTLIHLAGEPIPYFWPMRTFIHHNPLYGLEHLPFEKAVAEGERLFHARGYLPRSLYQRYLQNGCVDRTVLEAQVTRFLESQPLVADLDRHALLMAVLTEVAHPLGDVPGVADARDIQAAMRGERLPDRPIEATALAAQLASTLPPARPAHEIMDALYGTSLGATIDELVIKSCLDFFDEGQSAWQLPGREKGLYAAWRAVARHNLRLSIRGIHIKQILELDDTPEGIISHVMEALGVPEDDWMEYFTSELTRLHGWAGFIRWRVNTKHYYWSQRYPADLVDYLAIRMVLGLALIRERAQQHRAPLGADALAHYFAQKPGEAYLRHEFHGGQVLPALALRVEDALESGRETRIARLLPEYLVAKRESEARGRAAALRRLGGVAGCSDALARLSPDALDQLQTLLARFERAEGQMWLVAQEALYMNRLLTRLDMAQPQPQGKRPFAQILFCIDVRSERIRRHLEKVGDYQTYGIAGFFGVPVSFVGLDKGSETHLAPVVVTPKNLVLELAIARNADDEAFVSVLEQVFHDLKASVLSPFITVEAIGLLFGFDLFGKSLAPLAYNRWRQRLYPDKPDSRLLLDKLTREQADSIIRSLQRNMIVKAVGRELDIGREAITDEMVRELRETALGHQQRADCFAAHFSLDEARESALIERLRRVYRIDSGYTRMQLEQLGRIGFTLEEQVKFVSTALRSIGLTDHFSRFVVLAGHGSTSENNPYESALDCGACGGNHGIVSARVLAQMANKHAIRLRLRDKDFDIPDDAWFVPAFHNTTTDELRLHDLDLLPPSHLVYVERLSNGLTAASKLCAAERLPTLEPDVHGSEPTGAYRAVRRNAMDWSQVRPEWGLSRNAAFIIGRRHATEALDLEGRVFLHSYDWQCDRKGRLLENILTGPLVVGQWINMEHYFSTVDNEHYGSGSKVYHNVAGRFGVMSGNLSDLRTGLPAQTVLKDGKPYHEPLRLLTVIESPVAHAMRAIDGVVKVRNLVHNGWIRMVIVDPETHLCHAFENGAWQVRDISPADGRDAPTPIKERNA